MRRCTHSRLPHVHRIASLGAAQRSAAFRLTLALCRTALHAHLANATVATADSAIRNGGRAAAAVETNGLTRVQIVNSLWILSYSKPIAVVIQSELPLLQASLRAL